MQNVTWRFCTACVVLCASSCQTVSRSQPAFMALRVDTPEIVLGPDTNRRPWIVFTVVNTTANPVSAGTCLPNLEAQVADKWVVADYIDFLGGCGGAIIERGATRRDSVPIFGTGLENNIDLTRRSESGGNLYRLSWKLTEGTDRASKRARSVFAFSNAFRITVRRQPRPE